MVEYYNYKDILAELAPYALTSHKKLFESIKNKDNMDEVEIAVINYVEEFGEDFDCYILDEEIAEFLKLDCFEYRKYFYFND